MHTDTHTQNGPLSPPTPAPSPTPGPASWAAMGEAADRARREQGEPDAGQTERNVDAVIGPRKGKGKDVGQGKATGKDYTSFPAAFPHLPPPTRLEILQSLLPLLTVPELLMLSSHIGPRLKRDFLRDLPIELALHILSFVDDPRTLARASAVSRYWHRLLEDEQTWKEMCQRHRFQASGLAAGGGNNTAQQGTGYHRSSSPSTSASVSGPGITSYTHTLPPPLPVAAVQPPPGYQAPQQPMTTRPTPQMVVVPGASTMRSRRTVGSARGGAETTGNAGPLSVHLEEGNIPSSASAHHGMMASEHGSFSFNNNTAIPTATDTNAANASTGTGTAGTIPGSDNALRPVFGVTNPQMFAASRVERDSGLMEVDSIVPLPAAPGSAILPAAIVTAAPPPNTFHELVPNREGTAIHAPSSPVQEQFVAPLLPATRTTTDDGAHPLLPSASTDVGEGAAGGSGGNPFDDTTALDAPHAIPSVWDNQNSDNYHRQQTPLPSVVAAAATSTVGSGGSTRRESALNGSGEDDEPVGFSYKAHFKKSYLTESNWLRGGKLLSSHTSHDDGVVTSLAVDGEFIVIGMANSKIHVFSARDGTFVKTLVGHELGVWCLTLVSPTPPTSTRQDGRVATGEARAARQAGEDGEAYVDVDDVMEMGDPGFFSSRSASSAGPSQWKKRRMRDDRQIPTHGSSLGGGISYMDQDEGDVPAPSSKARRMQQSDVCGAAKGWGQRDPIVISGGCDRDVKVWNVTTGQCLHTLSGHTSTIRCMKTINGRPVAVSGSRDASLRVWDVERGVLMHTLSGHQHSVRCIEVAGNQVASGSYDCTCRIWDLDTGECLQVLRGHYHQIYAVAFDGERVATGSLDSTVRIWSAATGECVALLQGHTSLVGQLQLSHDTLVTGGSDGRVIIFDLVNYTCLQRICAHDNSVTCLQFDDRFIVSGGNDGRVKLWDVKTGHFIRELSKPCEAVWRVTFRDDKCAILCKRHGKTVLEVLSFVPEEE